MGLFGGGHSGNSSKQGPELANPQVRQRLAGDVSQYASAVGLTLSQQQIDDIINKAFPSSSQFSGVSTDSDREAAYQNAKQFILPNVQRMSLDQIKNPAISDEQRTKYTTDVNRIFSQTLGRNANQDEIDYFGKEIAKGASPYEIGQALQGTSEYQQSQATIQQQKYKEQADAARAALNDQLLNSQQEAFSRATPAIIASYMRAGRLNSSGLNNAIAQAQADLDRERQGFIGNAGFQQAVQGAGYNQQNFVNNQSNAFQNYLNQSVPGIQQKNSVQNLANNLNFGGAAQGILNRQNELFDYNQQMNDFNRYASQSRSSSLGGALQGALGGASVGAKFGPMGALYGGLAGGAVGYAAYR